MSDVCIHDLDLGTCSLCRPGGRARGGSKTGAPASVHFDQATVELEAPYDEDFIRDLKAALPGYARRWDRDRKVWVIASEWWDHAEAVVSEYFDLAD